MQGRAEREAERERESDAQQRRKGSAQRLAARCAMLEALHSKRSPSALHVAALPCLGHARRAGLRCEERDLVPRAPRRALLRAPALLARTPRQSSLYRLPAHTVGDRCWRIPRDKLAGSQTLLRRLQAEKDTLREQLAAAVQRSDTLANQHAACSRAAAQLRVELLSARQGNAYHTTTWQSEEQHASTWAQVVASLTTVSCMQAADHQCSGVDALAGDGCARGP